MIKNAINNFDLSKKLDFLINGAIMVLVFTLWKVLRFA